MFTLLFLILATSLLDIVLCSSDHCCCCEISDYYEISRVWTTKDKCDSPKICCNIPSQYECELDLNPTFDGSCGHENESKYQLKNGGTKPVVIPRNGESDSYELKGWFGQRWMDQKGNEMQEWCFDNGNYDSFFLFRFVNCDGSYPNWFGRCVFPSANNAIMYAECDSDTVSSGGCDYSEFSESIPSCFGEIEHINIGEGSDYGRDVDYRLAVADSYEWIWCSKNGKPHNPPKNGCLYSQSALSSGDGITPFYLTQCRDTVNITLLNDIELPSPLLNSNNNNNNNNDNNATVREMKPTSFRVAIKLENKEIDMRNDVTYIKYSFLINGNNMPEYYHASIKSGDSWSLALKSFKIEDIISVAVPNEFDWSYIVKSVKNGTYITFISNVTQDIELKLNVNVTGFNIIVKYNITENVNIVGHWIARTIDKKHGNFVGYGKISL